MRKQKIIILILFFILLVTARSGAEETNSVLQLDFKEALRLAQKENINVLTAKERVLQSMESIGQTRATLLPQLTLNASETRQTRNLESFGIPPPGGNPLVGPFNVFDARVQLTQSLFDRSVVERLSLARSQKKISESELKKIRQDLLALSATLYVQAKRALQTIDLAQNILAKDQENFQIIHKQNEVGVGSELDVKKAKSVLENSRFRLTQAKKNATQALLDLKATLGIASDQEVLLTEDFSKGPDMAAQSPANNDHIRSHPDRLLAQENLNNSVLQKNLELAEYFPRISAVGDYGKNGMDVSSSETTYMLGLQLSYPIFDAGLRPSRVRAAESRRKENELTLKDLDRQLQNQVLIAEESVEQSRALIDFQNAQSDAATAEFLQVQEKFNNGSGSSLDRMEAQTREAIALDEKEEAFALYKIAQINLAHALGSMDKLAEE